MLAKELAELLMKNPDAWVVIEQEASSGGNIITEALIGFDVFGKEGED